MKKFVVQHCPYISNNLELKVHPSPATGTFCDGRTMDYIMSSDSSTMLKSIAYMKDKNLGEKWESDHALMFLDVQV